MISFARLSPHFSISRPAIAAIGLFSLAGATPPAPDNAEMKT